MVRWGRGRRWAPHGPGGTCSATQLGGDNTPSPRNSATVVAVPSRTTAQPSLLELAEDWLAAKRALESAAQAEKGNSDRARRAHPPRQALILRGAPPPDAPRADGPAVRGRRTGKDTS